MDIKYLGHSSFLIKGREARLVTDPFDSKMVGLKYPKVEADIVTVSHQHADHNQSHLITGSPLIIDWPGQFERKAMRVTGYSSFHDKKKGAERGVNILYKIEDELTVLHCGDLGMIPDDSFIDELGDIDILMVPVGGFYTLDADEAMTLIKKIDPSIVIPMHYCTPEHSKTGFEKVAPLDVFLKKMGAESVVPVPKLTLKKEEMEESEMKVVTMVQTS